jgi:hypothetical protein
MQKGTGINARALFKSMWRLWFVSTLNGYQRHLPPDSERRRRRISFPEPGPPGAA